MALHTRVLRLVLSGLMGALLVVSKQAMSGLPNLEPVSLLIILFALELPRETPGAITVFILLQGVLYGFGLWWVMYLYVWYLLALLAWLLRRMDYAFFWAVLSGLYGLCFGGLCAAVYLFAKTPAFALSWWLSGLSYDALHGVGNFVLMLLLYRPLRRALRADGLSGDGDCRCRIKRSPCAMHRGIFLLILSGWCPCSQRCRCRSQRWLPQPFPDRGRSGAGPCWGCPGAC